MAPRTALSVVCPTLVVGILLFLLLTKGVTAYLVTKYPDTSGDSGALLVRADRAVMEALRKTVDKSANSRTGNSVDGGQSGATAEPAAGADPVPPNLAGNIPIELDDTSRAQIRGFAKRALGDEPLRARALEILGMLTPETAPARTALMRAAAKRSYRAQYAIFWRLNKSLAERNFPAAAADADALLRANPEAIAIVEPILTALAQDAEGQRVMIGLLKDNPPWRGSFFSLLDGNIRDARTPFALLSALGATAHPATRPELGAYLRLLIAHKFYDLAYGTWLQFLPFEQLAKAALLFNGDFQFPLSGLAFDWSIAGGDGVSVEAAQRDDDPGKTALLVDFGGNGRVEFPAVSQMLVLAPGPYRFSGLIKGEIKGPRGLVWGVYCQETNSAIAETDMLLGNFPQWQAFSRPFAVPEGCKAQSVRLFLDARSASETFVSGMAWFRDLRIESVEK